jgi:hypothetical protein
MRGVVEGVWGEGGFGFRVGYEMSATSGGVRVGIVTAVALLMGGPVGRVQQLLLSKDGVGVVSNEGLGSRAGCVLFGEGDGVEAQRVEVFAECRGVLGMLCGAIEGVLGSESFLGVGVTALIWNKSGKEGWVSVGRRKFGDAIGSRRLLKAMTISTRGKFSQTVRTSVLASMGMGGGGGVLDEKVFFSHCWGDWTHKRGLVKVLRDAAHTRGGLQTWLDYDVFGKEAGTDLAKGMREGVENASVALVFLTREYLLSANCRFEATEALRRADEGSLSIYVIVGDMGVLDGGGGWLEGVEAGTAAAAGEVLTRLKRVLFDTSFVEFADAANEDILRDRILKSTSKGEGGSGPLLDVFVGRLLELILQGDGREGGTSRALLERLEAVEEANVENGGGGRAAEASVTSAVASAVFNRMDVNKDKVVQPYELIQALMDLGYSFQRINAMVGGRVTFTKEELRELLVEIAKDDPSIFDWKEGRASKPVGDSKSGAAKSSTCGLL